MLCQLAASIKNAETQARSEIPVAERKGCRKVIQELGGGRRGIRCPAPLSRPPIPFDQDA